MRYDQVIVGASSAGLYAAELLAKKGNKVLLLDRQQEISPVERTYIITPGLFKVFPDFPRELIRHQTDLIQIHAGSASSLVQLNVPDLVIERSQLLRQLLLRAQAAGAEIRTGSEFLGVEATSLGTAIMVRNGSAEYSLEADQLIGADGVNSQVRSSCGLEPLQWVPLLQAVVALPDDGDDRVTKVWFLPDRTPYFYWLIPDQGNRAVVGLISPRGSDIRQLLDAFLKEQGLEPEEYQSGTAALHNLAPGGPISVGNIAVFLVGDAAGQVKVTTVGGTVTGLIGAKAAVEGISDQPDNKRTYHSVRNELNLHFFIRRLLNGMKTRDYQLLIRCMSPAVKGFLSQYHRDEMRRNFWKLAFIQPRLVPLGLRLAVKSLFSRVDHRIE